MYRNTLILVLLQLDDPIMLAGHTRMNAVCGRIVFYSLWLEICIHDDKMIALLQLPVKFCDNTKMWPL